MLLYSKPRVVWRHIRLKPEQPLVELQSMATLLWSILLPKTHG